jgi:hypothetical protein
MKVILQTILIIAVGFVAHQVLPFWVISLVAAVTGLLFNYKTSLSSFAAGFVGGALLWGGMAWWLNSANAGTLSGQLGEMFSISGAALLWITGGLGGMLGGLGAMAGSLARRVFGGGKKSLSEAA